MLLVNVKLILFPYQTRTEEVHQSFAEQTQDITVTYSECINTHHLANKL